MSFSTLARLICDQMLRLVRGVKRCRKYCASSLLRWPSI
jgi:hypothetical protein